jgi:hypothetical protein
MGELKAFDQGLLQVRRDLILLAMCADSSGRS